MGITGRGSLLFIAVQNHQVRFKLLARRKLFARFPCIFRSGGNCRIRCAIAELRLHRVRGELSPYLNSRLMHVFRTRLHLHASVPRIRSLKFSPPHARCSRSKQTFTIEACPEFRRGLKWSSYRINCRAGIDQIKAEYQETARIRNPLLTLRIRSVAPSKLLRPAFA